MYHRQAFHFDECNNGLYFINFGVKTMHGKMIRLKEKVWFKEYTFVCSVFNIYVYMYVYIYICLYIVSVYIEAIFIK